LITALSLQPLEGSDVALSNSTHTLKLFGKTVSGGRVAALIKMAFSSKTGVTTKITIRAEEEGVAPAVMAALA
jgi:coatomer protein complex subunit gamma